MTTTHKETLESIYIVINSELEANNFSITIPQDLDLEIIAKVDLLAQKSENYLGVINVTITSLTEKIVNLNQDIRLHQAKMNGGYSGRTLDTKVIAPWLKSKKLKSMVESGWLTRSLEQDAPYTLDYRGAIRDKDVKLGFLTILDYIQKKPEKAKICLAYLLQLLIIQREQNKIEIQPLLNKGKYNIDEIIKLLTSHFEISNQVGTARLPVLAVYAVYQSFILELKRFEGKILQPLGSHTSADLRSGDIGDIQINNEDSTPFEGVEIKYKKKIDSVLVEDAYEKLKSFQVSRYYLLSTEMTIGEELDKIKQTVKMIQSEHGCQIIVNGLLPSIKYYLRLINNLDQFILNYTNNVLNDPAVKIEHKKLWKDLIEQV